MHPITFVALGIASWFSRESSGTVMANGQPMIDSAHVCATRHLEPYGTKLLLVNDENGAESWCIVSDYGPAAWTERIIDVSPVVRDDLGFAWTTHVRIYRYLTPKEYHAPSTHPPCAIRVFCPIVGNITCQRVTSPCDGLERRESWMWGRPDRN